MQLREHISLAPFTTFGIGGDARYFVSAHHDDDVREAVRFAKDKQLPLLVVGGGSNLLIADSGFSGLVLHVTSANVSVEERDKAATLIADAGVEWDALVAHSVTEGLWGLENLSSIPGKVGASVVQNIGAYGVEAGNLIAWVEVYNPHTDRVARLTKEDCRFGYRDSLFKSHQGKELVVLRVAFMLSREGVVNLGYKDLVQYDREINKIMSLADARDAVIHIREKKFPELTSIGTAGSFFKNPVVSKEKADEFLHTYPHASSFPQQDGTVKLSAAWIIDNVLHIKGERVGDVGAWGAQALVLVNYGHATAYDVASYANTIIEKCFTSTGIQLEPEVVYVGDIAQSKIFL